MKPVLEFYRKRGMLHSIDGEQDPGKIFREIVGILVMDRLQRDRQMRLLHRHSI